MKRHSLMVGALALLALVGGAWILSSRGGSDASRGPATTVAAGPSASDSPLRLSRRGRPIVWLRRGDRIPLRAAPRGEVVKELPWRTQFGSRTVLAVFARRGDWVGVPTPLLANGRLGWVKLDPSRLRAGWTRYSIHVDLSSGAARLRLGHRVLRSFPVTVGAPASPTPTGRFAVTDMFKGHLNPAYGCCALATTATQPRLPSGWLGGDRIAIHGTTDPVGGASSHGCIRAANADVGALVDRVGLGTPVLIHQ
jgi:L,D-transpeptidase catalytic domain